MIKIQILGTDNTKTERLADNAAAAVRELGIECEIEKIKDIDGIVEYGAPLIPALAINGELKVIGEVADVEDIKALFK